MVKNSKFKELNIGLGLFLEYTNFEEDFIEYKCLCCNNNYQQVWWKVKGVIF